MTEDQEFLEWRNSHVSSMLALQLARELREHVLYGMIESAIRGAYFHSKAATYSIPWTKIGDPNTVYIEPTMSNGQVIAYNVVEPYSRYDSFSKDKE